MWGVLCIPWKPNLLIINAVILEERKKEGIISFSNSQLKKYKEDIIHKFNKEDLLGYSKIFLNQDKFIQHIIINPWYGFRFCYIINNLLFYI